MIATDRRSPQQALAEALGGTILGPNHIAFAGHLVSTRLALVFVDDVRVGHWSDDTETLAEQVRRAVGVTS